uniref:Putative nadh dehydrogenase ubiquinone iron-sulfur protein 4 mitochondrial isoform x2 n=1 Tax=Ixodes ricinus TaxID=34613 RepID=A0A6B0V252_IXORI
MRARHLHWALLPTMIAAAIFEESLTSDDGAPDVTLAPNNSHDGGPLVIEMDSSSYYSSPSRCQSETVSLPNKAQAVKDCTCVSGSDYEYVNEGRECVYSSNASVIQVGTCSDGECTEENLTTHEISKNPREQHYNPEDDLCMQLTMKVNQDILAENCTSFCDNGVKEEREEGTICLVFPFLTVIQFVHRQWRVNRYSVLGFCLGI